MNDELVTLVTMIPDGVKIEPKEVEIFAEKKSLTRSEFYAAYTVGLSGKFVFTVNPDDFDLSKCIMPDNRIVYASQLKYENGIYNIIRTYHKKSSNELEIVVE